MNTTRVRVLLLGLAALAAPLAARADGGVSFDYPLLGDAERMVVNPYIDGVFGVAFTALPRGGVAGEVGLVRNRSALPCFLPNDPNQTLGTATLGSGNIGNESFPIRIDFPQPLVPPVQFSLKVYTFHSVVVHVTLLDEGGSPIASAYHQDVYDDGSCLSDGVRERHSLWSDVPVSSMLIDAEGGVAVYVIDDLQWSEHVVAVQPTTWGRVKALYH